MRDVETGNYEWEKCRTQNILLFISTYLKCFSGGRTGLYFRVQQIPLDGRCFLYNVHCHQMKLKGELGAGMQTSPLGWGTLGPLPRGMLELLISWIALASPSLLGPPSPTVLILYFYLPSSLHMHLCCIVSSPGWDDAFVVYGTVPWYVSQNL